MSRSTVLRAVTGAAVAGLAYLLVVQVVRGSDGWSAPVDLSTATQQADVSRAQVGVDARGNATALWSDGNSVLRTAVRPAGGAWQKPVTLALARNFQYGPQLAVNAAGTAVAVWQRNDKRSDGFVVQAAVRPAGGAWQKPVDLSPGGSRRLAAGVGRRRFAAASRDPLPQVAIDRRGNAVVVWEHYRNGAAVVQAVTRPAGGAWRAPVDLADTSSDRDLDHALPDVAISPGGNAVAVWVSAVKLGYGPVQSATRRAGGRWQAPTTISTSRRAFGARVTVDARDVATAIWTSGASVQSARRKADGRWRAPVAVFTGRHPSAPDVAVDARGDAVAIWGSSTADKGIVQAAVRPAAGRWHRPVEISDSARGDYAGGANLAVGARGDAAVVWSVPDYDESQDDDQSPEAIVLAAVRPAGEDWRAPVKLNEPSDFPSDPRVEVGANGEVVAVWKGRMGIVQAAAR